MQRHRSKHLVLFAIAVLLTTTLGCLSARVDRQQQLAARLDEILNRHSDSGAIVSARVLELPDRRELYARDIDMPYTPASNMKVPVSAAGLDMFGPDHTFRTYLAVDGDDLWLIGTGDPGLGDPRLARRADRLPTSVFDDWLAALRDRGIERIEGDLYYYDDALDPEWTHATWGESVLHWYGAPVSGLNFNDNCVDITIEPTAPGQPVDYTVMPPVEHIKVINLCITGEEHDPSIIKFYGSNTYQITGTCAREADLKSKPVMDPGAFTCDALRTHFAAHGFTIAGRTHDAIKPLNGAVPPPAEKVVAVAETPLPDVIGRINTNSQNFFADALCKLTGQAYEAQQGRKIAGSWQAGELAIRTFLAERGIDHAGFALADGSGLSRDNKVTTRLMTDLFAVMHERDDAAIFRDSLAKGGIDGTLEERFAALKGRVFAKTGYIGGVRALSGYVQTDGGQWLTFSIIYNRIPGSVKPYEALQDEAVRLLATWPEL